MSYLDRLYHGRRQGTVPRLVHEVVEVSELALAGYGFGYIQNRWREKASIKGVPVDLLAGLALKTVSLAGDLLDVGGLAGKALPHLNVLGSAGIVSYFHTMGSSHGADHSGLKRLLVNESDLSRAQAMLPSATVLGAKAAPHGDYLTPRDIAELAR